MASSQKREVKTPELLPWLPAPKKKSFNILSEKKNSNQEMPEFGKSNAQDIFAGGENKKKSMSESRKTEDDRREMERRIKTVIEEDEEEEEEGRSNSADGRGRRRDRDGDRDGRSKSEDRRRGRSRSRSRRRYQRRGEDGDGDDEGFHDGKHGKHRSRKETKLRWNYGTQTTAGVFSGDSNGTSGLGDSLVQDIEEDATRRSIQFIDHVNPDLTQFDPEYRDAMDPSKDYYHQHPPGVVNQGYQQDINPPYGYPNNNNPGVNNNNGYPNGNANGNNNFQSLPPNMQLMGPPGPQFQQNPASSSSPSPAFGFASINLGQPNSRAAANTAGTREDWFLVRRTKGQNGAPNDNYDGRPMLVSLNESIGSRRAFDNMSKIRAGSEAFLVQEPGETPEQREERRRGQRNRAFWAGCATVFGGLVLLGIFVSVAVLTTNNGSGTGAPAANNPYRPERVNNGTGPCNDHTILREPWRRIPGSGSVSDDALLYCDKPGPGSTGTNVKLNEGWYRFKDFAGTYLPTRAPGADDRRVCGTNIVGWLNGEHPKVHEGIVDSEICFEWVDGPCQYTMQTKVRTCDAGNGDTFYVYYLKVPTFSCNYAFCAKG